MCDHYSVSPLDSSLYTITYQFGHQALQVKAFYIIMYVIVY